MAYTILIIEDDPIIRLGLVAAAEDFGFRVLEADNLRMATTQLYEGKYDAVLTDMQFPLLADGTPSTLGTVIVDWLHQHRRYIPYFVHTGMDFATTAMVFATAKVPFDLGFYLQKPSKGEAVMQRLHDMIVERKNG